ncbi:MAG TPA: hypothetical protein VFX22_05960 [Candidatus Kapabacteria bacterium]|nr:hypothetical protein [Candidatus Kapabacteria bacterium]
MNKLAISPKGRKTAVHPMAIEEPIVLVKCLRTFVLCIDDERHTQQLRSEVVG